ncbi:unnamed protein product [Prorocentrum cordatum]|uniref:Uncharacterized protein n=1 Tax=Prorocentrum cordatum TaxID=2364126 RepID=A0ABN9R9R1_9DINO|nr:unnamed protein product [Polarella glacialis]
MAVGGAIFSKQATCALADLMVRPAAVHESKTGRWIMFERTLRLGMVGPASFIVTVVLGASHLTIDCRCSSKIENTCGDVTGRCSPFHAPPHLVLFSWSVSIGPWAFVCWGSARWSWVARSRPLQDRAGEPAYREALHDEGFCQLAAVEAFFSVMRSPMLRFRFFLLACSSQILRRFA